MIDAGDGDNRIAGDGATLTATEYATLNASTDGDDTIISGAGADIVLGGQGGDTLITGAGDDLISGDGAVVILAANVATSATTRSSQGGSGDTIDAGAGDDVILGGAGADSITGGAGNDHMLGDFGTADLVGGVGLTSLDVVDGGDDTIAGGDGDDVAIGGAGINVFSDTGGTNIVIGGAGSLTAGGALTVDNSGPIVNQVLTGGAGNDLIIGGAGNDTITGLGGNDTIIGDAAEYIHGVSLSSITTGPFGDDVIDAGDGDDVVLGGGGSDTINLGAGNDVAFGDMGNILFGAGGVVIAMTATGLGEGAADTIEGGAGDDLMFGQGGADLLTDVSGSNIMIGDLATITFFDPSAAPTGGNAVDRVQTLTTIRDDIAFDDVIVGGSGRDLAVAGLGDDTITGNGGQDLLFGDTIEMERAYTINTSINSWVESISVRTTLTGAGGNDLIISGAEGDFVIADRGANYFETDFERNFVATSSATFVATGFMSSANAADPFANTATLGIYGSSTGGAGAGRVSFIPSGLDAAVIPAPTFVSNGGSAQARVQASYDTSIPLTSMESIASSDVGSFATQSRLLSDHVARIVASSAFVSEMAELQRYDLQHDMIVDSARASLLSRLSDAGLMNDTALFDALFDQMVMQMLEEILVLDLDAVAALAAE